MNPTVGKYYKVYGEDTVLQFLGITKLSYIFRPVAKTTSLYLLDDGLVHIYNVDDVFSSRYCTELTDSEAMAVVLGSNTLNQSETDN